MLLSGIVRASMTSEFVRDRRLSIGDVELEVFHQGAGAPMLILHGGDGLDPRARFLELLASRFEIIAPSHPGFGASPLPDRFDSVADLAYLYLDLLDMLDLREVVLVGFSLGGWIAAEIAVRCAHRLAKLVLVGAIGIKTGDRETREIPDIFALSADAVTKLMFHDPAKAGRDLPALSEDELRTIARNRESLALYTWEPCMHNPKLRYRLGRIRVPTMLIRGGSDGFVSEVYAEAYAALIPGACLETIPEAGQSPQLEKPEEFVRRVFAFAST
jgi:pimeloyl-ACP methyl ester carboxylesterase